MIKYHVYIIMARTWKENVYSGLLYSSYVLYVIIFLGIYSNAPRYLTTITRVTQLYICGLLLVRFNPLRVDIKFTDFDKQLVFSAAIFMFFTLVANVFANYLQNVKSYIEQPDKIGRFLDVNFN